MFANNRISKLVTVYVDGFDKIEGEKYSEVSYYLKLNVVLEIKTLHTKHLRKLFI